MTVDKTRLSSKGQVILPKSTRRAHNWAPGTEFSVEDADDGVLLRPLKPFQQAELADVFACLKYDGPARTLEEMQEVIHGEVRKRHASSRY